MLLSPIVLALVNLGTVFKVPLKALALLLKVVQSALLNAPLLEADAVGTFRVIKGVVVLLATLEFKSVPLDPKVNETLVTVPTNESAYCGMFKVFAINVATPDVPVVVRVIVPCLLLKVFQSVDDRYPSTDVVATGIEIVLVVLTKGEENVNTDSLLLNVLQSVDDNAPLLVADAVGTFNVITGVVVLLATVELRSTPVVPNVNAATDVTVPVFASVSFIHIAPLYFNTCPVIGAVIVTSPNSVSV
jgi:hypothetical protein